MRITHILATALMLSACNYAADAQKSDKSEKTENGASYKGAVTQQSFNTGDFEGIEMGGPYKAVVTVGGATSVRAEGDADMIARLDIQVEKGILEIRPKRERDGYKSWRDNPSSGVTIYITTPRLDSAAVAGSGNMRVDKIAGDKFDGVVAGSGDLEIASLRVDAAEFAVAGSGAVKAFGSVGSIEISVAGSGDIDLAGINSRQIEVSVAGSGNVLANASETADISMIGSGDVTIKGTARCEISKHGSGDVRCGV